MPLTNTLTLSGGRVVQVRMPDMYELLSQVGVIPSAQQAALIRLLEGAGAIAAQGLQQHFSAMKDYLLGVYEIAALCLVEPRLRLKGEPGPGEIGPAGLSQQDLWDIYNRFFWAGPPKPAIPEGNSTAPPAENPEGTQDAPPAGKGVPDAAIRPARRG